MAGFNKLMRYCDTLAQYEAAKANGTVTDDTLVIVVQDKVAKFKGQTFDWSGGGDTSSLATKEELENLTNEILKNEEVSAAAFNDLNQRVDNVDISLDSELSDTSTSAVENKAIKSYVDSSSANVKAYTDAEVAKKVDKVEGKQLSTEDFTSALKTKLEGLSNYDDTEISNAVDGLQTQIDTLVSGDASTAIESFNEIIAFLNGVEDTESLDSIIASIEQQIAAKQDVIEDLATIREGAALGMTALQAHQDISHLATKEEVTNLQNEVIANEEVSAAAFNELNDRVNEIAANVGGSAATKEELAAAVATLEAADTATNTAVTAVDDKVDALEASVAETYATKTEVQTEVAALNGTIATLQNEVIDNEEVTAASLNDINDKVKQLGADSEATYATKTALQAAVDTLNATILNNEEIIEAAFNDINTRKADVVFVQEVISEAVTNVLNTEV